MPPVVSSEKDSILTLPEIEPSGQYNLYQWANDGASQTVQLRFLLRSSLFRSDRSEMFIERRVR